MGGGEFFMENLCIEIEYIYIKDHCLYNKEHSSTNFYEFNTLRLPCKLRPKLLSAPQKAPLSFLNQSQSLVLER